MSETTVTLAELGITHDEYLECVRLANLAKDEKTNQPSLDEQLAAWLKERNAGMVFIAKGPNSGTPVPISDFIRNDGLHVPAGWPLDITVVEKRQQ